MREAGQTGLCSCVWCGRVTLRAVGGEPRQRGANTWQTAMRLAAGDPGPVPRRRFPRCRWTRRHGEPAAYHLVACSPHAFASDAPDGSRRWSARAVADWMAVKLGRPVRPQRGWAYLQRLKHSQQLPRPHHALANPKQQAEFEKAPPARECSGDRLPPRAGGGVGHRRTSQWPQTAAPAHLGADWSATSRTCTAPLCLALLDWLCASIALVNRHFATIEELEEAQLAQCVALQRQSARIRSTTRFHWWP